MAIPTETAEAQLSRLAAANARVQADLDQRLASEPQWRVERVLLKAIINQVPEQLYAKDTKGRFVAANDVVARDNGLQRAEELTGKTDFDLFPAKVAQGFFDVEQQISIDDFGTGYSSLSALKSFPVARLKIDQSFVRNLPCDANDRSIATAVISLGQKLNMKVIAEGVETDAQMAFLAEHDCDEIQGYHFSRPIESDAVASMLRAQMKAA